MPQAQTTGFYFRYVQAQGGLAGDPAMGRCLQPRPSVMSGAFPDKSQVQRAHPVPQTDTTVRVADADVPASDHRENVSC